MAYVESSTIDSTRPRPNRWQLRSDVYLSAVEKIVHPKPKKSGWAKKSRNSSSSINMGPNSFKIYFNYGKNSERAKKITH